MYLDPGFGSIAIQALIGLAVALPALLVVFRSKVMSFFRRNRKKSEKDS